MEALWQYIPLLSVMVVLLGCSAFFSCSEAALFYLGREDRRAMQHGGPAQRSASDLVRAPRRLLSAILFWNLLINLAYFTLASIIGIRLDMAGEHTAVGAVAIGSLLALIVLGEMLPKTVAVIHPQLMSRVVSLPLAAAVWLVDPLMPLLGAMRVVSQRLFFPQFEPESYLELRDLEQAIALGTTDETLAERERAALGNVVSLSETLVEEVMRPRLYYRSYRPPVSLDALEGQMPPSGYLLVTEPDSDEVAASVALSQLSDWSTDRLDAFARSVCYVPWCATVATALDDLRRNDRQVAAVINEHGETIGIVTIDDILEMVLLEPSSRSERVLRTASLTRTGDHTWEATGMTTLRRLSARLGKELPATKSVTVAGVLQEELQRLPAAGDVVRWGGLEFTVVSAPERGLLKAKIKPIDLTQPAP